MRTIMYSKSAAAEADALRVPIREAVIGALERYAIHGTGDVIRLSGLEMHRLRQGRCRVIFELSPDTFQVLQVGKRDTRTYSRL